MGGIFGVVAQYDCVKDVFFGTDYHSHLGTSRAGMAFWAGNGFLRSIHNIENAQFRTKFEGELSRMKGNMGIGCISDYEPQPLTVRSHLGNYAITTVGRINNIDAIVDKFFEQGNTHFLEMSEGRINPTELVTALIDQESSFEDGICRVQETIDGSCTMLILTPKGIYAARDRFGRTPLVIGEKEGALCASTEACVFPNLGYEMKYELGPAEIVHITPDGMERIKEPEDKMKICAFLWVYFGYPASSYEGTNVEVMRYRSGAALARRDDVDVDMVAAVPDTGIAHAIGYANESKIPYGRPFVKYTPTWPRSFMPREQAIRDLVARMKLIPIYDLTKGKRILFCEDSIVRGTQLREPIELLYASGAKEVHVRVACPPLLYSCKYLNFSRSRSETDLITRRVIGELEGSNNASLEEYADPSTEKHCCMVDKIRELLNLTSLKYQNMDDMLEAIGIPKEKICTYCWNGRD